ncbi:hypothetical protein BDFB_014904 [Asbolus verrucosus]|uniref:Uncharacterized protein n=1 Tax=Asbolus verrucosus TaxID=1661398 RepID=A0A482VE20_ASBVE|nr:hypothetical protein BDFB_014904 [Asbolus verrucosus]
MRDMVCNPCAEMTLSVHNDRKIVRTSTYEVISKPENKIYRVNYTKRRRLQDSFDTYPYGFKLDC